MILTNAIRDQICNNAKTHTFKRRIENLKNAKAALGQAIHQELVGQHIEAMSKLPAGFMPKTMNIDVQFGACHGYASLPLQAASLVPHFFTKYGAAATFDARHKYSITWEKITNRASKLKSDQNELGSNIRGVLNSVTTVKRLLEVWPEAKRFLPEGDKPTNLPALHMADLNSAIAAMSAEE